MSPDPRFAVPVGLVCVLTLVAGMSGLRLSRTTSDFYVAGRAVSPRLNASAIAGEYLSGVSFLGVAGLLYAGGTPMLWFPVGYTLGHVVLLALVAAPLRRSGAYTAPDFAEARLQHRGVRRLTSVAVVLIGWAYLVLQLHGAGLALRTLTGAPAWLGGLLVGGVVTGNVVAGGMRSVTLVQAGQYWVKLAALAIPALVLAIVWWTQPGPFSPPPTPPVLSATAENQESGLLSGYTLTSTLVGLGLGTMALPHVVVRFYTNPDGWAARRTTVGVIGLVSLFYLLPPVYALLGLAHLPTLPDGVTLDALVLTLPSVLTPGPLATTLTGVLAAGAFAALLSTTSGLAVAVTGVLDQDIVRPGLARLTDGDATSVAGFRLAALVAMVVPLALVPLIAGQGLAASVTLLFAVAAATLSPLLVLGVWWRGLTARGAMAGMVCGGASSVLAATLTAGGVVPAGPWQQVLAAPAAWSVPLAFAVTVLVSRASADRIPPGVVATMARLHTPESVDLRRLRP